MVSVMRRVTAILFLPLSLGLVSCQSSSVLPPVKLKSAVDENTYTPKLPPPFLERLRSETKHVPTLPPGKFGFKDGSPTIVTSTGEFLLMDASSIANRKWIPPATATLLAPALPYAEYVNSDAFLRGIDRNTLIMPPPHKAFDNQPSVPIPIRNQYIR